MKKIVVCLFVALLDAQIVFAQWAVGARTGVSWSKTPYFRSNNSGYQKGWIMALVGNYAFNERFELQGELLYSQRGVKDFVLYTSGHSSSIENIFPADLKSHYFDIPVLVQFYPFSRTECFSLQAGIKPGISLSDTYNVNNDDLSKAMGDVNAIDMGLILGCACKFKQGIFVDGRYILGLTDHYKHPLGMAQGHSFELSVGYLFTLR